jgi:hypothetical protein
MLAVKEIVHNLHETTNTPSDACTLHRQLYIEECMNCTKRASWLIATQE